MCVIFVCETADFIFGVRYDITGTDAQFSEHYLSVFAVKIYNLFYFLHFSTSKATSSKNGLRIFKR